MESERRTEASPQHCFLHNDSDGQSESSSDSPSDLEAIYAFDKVLTVTKEHRAEIGGSAERGKGAEAEKENEEERAQRRARNLALLDGGQKSCKDWARPRQAARASGQLPGSRQLAAPRQRERGGGYPQVQPLGATGPSWMAAPSSDQARNRNGTPVPTGKRAPVQRPVDRQTCKLADLSTNGPPAGPSGTAGRALPLVPGWDSLPRSKAKKQQRF
mmetsp:Transcript_85818/g.161591  ORF Transcript_85818/g.161591 Transcript_85818/m.161591 type:complete len:216 (-) Transcript_85818:45-692(-)